MRPPKAKMLSRNLVTAFFWFARVGVVAGIYECILLYHTILQHYTRQQTTTVDNKHLFNGLVLTRFASLQRNTKTLHYGSKANRQQRNKRLRQR
jgi:hypothetical protein